MTLFRMLVPLTLLLMALSGPISLADEKCEAAKKGACCDQKQAASVPVLSKLPYVWKLFKHPAVKRGNRGLGMIKLSCEAGQGKYKGVKTAAKAPDCCKTVSGCGTCCKPCTSVKAVKDCKCAEKCECDNGCKCAKSVKVGKPQPKQYHIEVRVSELGSGKVLMQPRVVVSHGRPATVQVRGREGCTKLNLECEQIKLTPPTPCPVDCPPCMPVAMPHPPIMPPVPFPHPLPHPLPAPHMMPMPHPLPVQAVRVSEPYVDEAVIEQVSQRVADRVAEILAKKAQVPAACSAKGCEEATSLVNTTTLTTSRVRIRLTECGKVEMTNGSQGVMMRCEKFKCAGQKCEVTSAGRIVLHGGVKLYCQEGSYKGMFSGDKLEMVVRDGKVEMELSTVK